MNVMKLWFALILLTTGPAGCNLVDLGCTSDQQCRTQRACIDARCQWVGAPPADTDETNHDATNGGIAECAADTECGSDFLCREGVCDEFRCRNADGTDTSPDCDCDNFEFQRLRGGCSYEQHCFSGNLLMECVPGRGGASECTCYEGLNPISDPIPFGEDEACGSPLPRDMIYELCGWEFP